MKDKRKINGSLLFLLFLIILFCGICLYIFFHIQVDEYSERLKGNYEITHGIIVHDQGRPILTQLLFIHPQTHRAALYYIPENTGTIIESQDRMDRIDSLFDPQDPRAYLDKIDRMLGTQTDFYITIELSKWEDMIDWLEGIEVFIPHEVWQVEEEYNLLPSGRVLLDGGKLASYLSYKLPEDMEGEQVNRKLLLVRSFLGRIVEQAELFEDEDYFQLFYSFLDSNMDRQSFQSFLEELQLVQIDRIITQRVLGRIRQVDDQQLLFPLYDERLLKEMVSQIVENLANLEISEDSGLVISVEIQNGTSINGLASRTAQLFQSYGFRIASVKNADESDYDQTIILDRNENPVAAQRVANLIRCERIFQSPEEFTDQTVDVIIILGKDFDGRYVK